MTSPRRVQLEEAFRSAVNDHDLSRAQTTLQDYITWFRSATRNREEIEAARQLFQWAIGAASTHKVKMAEELRRLKTVLDAYVPRRSRQTWRVVG